MYVLTFNAAGGWEFYGKEHRSASAPIQQLISGHECMTYRFNSGSCGAYVPHLLLLLRRQWQTNLSVVTCFPAAYEHIAMVGELVRRLGVTGDAGGTARPSAGSSSKASAAKAAAPATKEV